MIMKHDLFWGGQRGGQMILQIKYSDNQTIESNPLMRATSIL